MRLAKQALGRPNIPPVLFGGLGMWLGAAAFYSFGQVLAVRQCSDLFICGLALCVSSFIGLCLGKKVRTWALCIGICLGCSFGSYAACIMQVKIDVLEANDVKALQLQVIKDSSEGAFGASCVAYARADDGRTYTVRVNADKGTSLPYGTLVTCSAPIKTASIAQQQNYWMQGISGSVRLYTFELEAPDGIQGLLYQLRQRMLSSVEAVQSNQEEAQVLLALTCGAKGELTQTDTYEQFKTAGLAHIVAVSGAHLSIVGAGIALVLRRIGLSVRMIAVVQGLLVAAYLVVSAMPISGIRAAIMMCCAVSAIIVQRRSASLNALGLSLIVLIALDPPCSVALSFVLSASSTLGIVLLSPLIQSWIKGAWSSCPTLIEDGLALTVSSSICSMPLSIALFGQVSIVAPLSNIVIAPIFTAVCAGGIILLLIASLVPGTQVLVYPALFGSRALCTIVSWCAAVPHAATLATVDLVPALILTIVVVSALWVYWPRFNVRYILVAGGIGTACFLVVSLLSFDNEDPELIMLDVGQGDAFLVRDGASAVLIDTGNQDALLRTALARQGIHGLDAVVISHADDDHCGSLKSLSSVCAIDVVAVSQPTALCDCASCRELIDMAQSSVGSGIVYLSVGDRIRVGRIELIIIAPGYFKDDGGNADSLCLLMRTDPDGDGTAEYQALFCGDAEAAQMQYLLDTYEIEDIDIYKVGHHGSKAALNEDIARSLRPRLSLISVGENNRYGHPNNQTIEALKSVDSRIMRTDLNGDVSIKFRQDAMEVKTLR